jgi:hypothetical protein
MVDKTAVTFLHVYDRDWIAIYGEWILTKVHVVSGTVLVANLAVLKGKGMTVFGNRPVGDETPTLARKEVLESVGSNKSLPDTSRFSSPSLVGTNRVALTRLVKPKPPVLTYSKDRVKETFYMLPSPRIKIASSPSPAS